MRGAGGRRIGTDFEELEKRGNGLESQKMYWNKAQELEVFLLSAL